MKCEYCGKKIEGRKRRYCNLRCNRTHYYQKVLKYKERTVYDLCKCGSRKHISSKQCLKCHSANKHKGQLSRQNFK